MVCGGGGDVRWRDGEEDGDVVDMGDEEELMEVEVEGAGGGGV